MTILSFCDKESNKIFDNLRYEQVLSWLIVWYYNLKLSQLFSNKFKVKNQYKKQKRTKKTQKCTNVFL